MNPARTRQPQGLLAPAARAAVRFLARRNRRRVHGAWRPMALQWKLHHLSTGGASAGSTARARSVVWSPSIHLHVMARASDYRQGEKLPGSLPVAATQLTRAALDHWRGVIQSGAVAAHARHDPDRDNVAASRYSLGGLREGRPFAAPELSSARRPAVVRHGARGSLSASLSGAELYGDAARRPFAHPTTTQTEDRQQYPALGRPSLRARLGTGAQAARSLETFQPETHVRQLRNRAPGTLEPPSSREDLAAPPFFHPQELDWRRTVPGGAGSSSGEDQVGALELEWTAPRRSIPGQGPSSEVPLAFGHAPSPPALKFDSAMIDRLADDVIRRVERRERIERARRGL